ncbi:MAG TPA: FHA domain-containing protein [Vicinamibacterales bacterium]|nr:FHA domain-containing protein [Vicinamibacterales bacterium]
MSGWILRGANGGAAITFRLRPGSVRTIGRAARADFIVDAALVSRLHCRLTATRDGVEVEDLRSTNGTFVNGARVTRATLAPGDVLGIGRVRLTLERTG